MIYERILHFAKTTPDKTAFRRNGVDSSYRDFAEAIQTARAEFAQRELSAQKVVGVAVVEIRKFWICALALRSIGITVLPIRSPDDLPDLSVPGLKSVVGNRLWTKLSERCGEEGLSLVPLPVSNSSRVTVGSHPIGDGGQLGR